MALPDLGAVVLKYSSKSVTGGSRKALNLEFLLPFSFGQERCSSVDMEQC